jgi:hypothetical protein
MPSLNPLVHAVGDPSSLLLRREAYETIEERMLDLLPPFSFTHQMAAAVATEPTAFLLTANSAVPLADSIRGFYDALSVEHGNF